MRDAAFIAERFKIDPVAVISEPDPWRYAVRIAAAQIIAAAEKEAKDRKG